MIVGVGESCYPINEHNRVTEGFELELLDDLV